MITSANAGAHHRGGLDFYALARGHERNYSCSYLVNLDPDLLTLISGEDINLTPLDMARNTLIQHTKRIFKVISQKSGRDMNQFCFGSTYIQLNSNYRKFDQMDPMTWKKEGISGHWTGVRGYRKSCCKVCCRDIMCGGCRKEEMCHNGPIRGSYDGLVVLTAITKESLPSKYTIVPAGSNINDLKSKKAKQELEKRLDHEDFAISLENLLTTHFLYGKDAETANRVVPSHRMAMMLGEATDEPKKQKKYTAYAVYVAYRLESDKFRNMDAMLTATKFQKLMGMANLGGASEAAALLSKKLMADDVENKRKDPNNKQMWAKANNLEDFKEGIDDDDDDEFSEEMAAMLDSIGAPSGMASGDFDLSLMGPDDDLDNTDGVNDENRGEVIEDKLLLSRIEALEKENSAITEKVWKLEHSKTWVENRLGALETDLNAVQAKLGIAPLQED